MKRFRSLSNVGTGLLAGSALLALFSQFSVAADSTAAAAPVTEQLVFEKDVRPVLKAYCLDCHGGEAELSGGLDLRLRRFIVAGGESGSALTPGAPSDSLVLQKIVSGEMPPGEKKVPAEKIRIIEQWIAAGAPTFRDEPLKLDPGIGITSEERSYWAFQPLQRPEVPPVKGGDLVRTPIDAFILAKLEEQDLSINPETDRFTLLKRAYFDLIGLPPSLEETKAFLEDESPSAYEAMLERLLASKHYGERWGRHWLDVAGYADSEGDGNTDTVRPYIYKYRDYVIKSLNEDKPLNQFIIEQLAGDELVRPPYQNMSPESISTLVATGFLRMAADPTASGQGNTDESRNLVMADTIKIVSTSLLGMSVGCAQCHDHRYDPIPQADYFRLRAIFEPALNVKNWVAPRSRVVSLYTDADRAKAAEIDAEANKLQAVYNEKQARMVAEAFEKALEKFPEDQRDALRTAFKTPDDKKTDEQKQLVATNPGLNVNPGVLYQFNNDAAEELKKDMAVIQAKRAEKPVEDFISVLTEPAGELPVTHVFHRGDYRQPTTPVKPGDLTIAAPDGERFEIAEKAESLPSSGRRLAWAQHLVNGKHPLVGRVLANRIWLHHFGRGIVDTPGEFGILGSRPTHPELLDWLADELVRQGWSLKRMHKLIMMSSVYRQSSRRLDQRAANLDSDGSLYSRYSVRRLEAEIVRDRMLATCGRIDTTQFGPSVEVMEDFAGQVHVKDDSPRRSVYIQARRSKPVSLLTAFDAPVMSINCERRTNSTVALQSLMLMNGDFTLKQAEHLAKRLRTESSVDLDRELTARFETQFPSRSAAWQYGIGAVDVPAQEGAGALASVRFQPLSHWTGQQWQAGPVFPDPVAGYALIHTAGGHPGDDTQRAVIRRWIAPQSGIVSLGGALRHHSDAGDGVRARVVSNQRGLVGTWTAKTNSVETNVPKIEVQQGEILDFVTDCIETVTSDSFEWGVKLQLTDAAGAELGRWDSAADFHGPITTSIPQQIACAWRLAYCRPITPEELEMSCQFMEQQLQTLRASSAAGDHESIALSSLCQQILSSNEFLYID
ncbi:PSD1 and planctomycete cytochrome C domain-containing protein [Schlesneria sp. T3-172]|uniref:PSD1 and planctomycete cytochrome C domain-containing protein n=1 Tax=Schlesneria sphaerica TaxID=3373610 RepID=UPI0037C93BA5